MGKNGYKSVKNNGAVRVDFNLSPADIAYLDGLIGADIVALRAQPVPRSSNQILNRAYSIRDRLGRLPITRKETHG